MNEQFFHLPEEKQQAIINASLEVFATHEYKRASTDDIAAKAGISKGLLFYYFHNKKSLYLYIYDYTKQIVTAQVVDAHFKEITDFFELLAYSAQKKTAIMSRNPYLMDFVMRCFYPEKEEVSDELNSTNQDYIDNSIFLYFKNVDFSRFRQDADPQQILRRTATSARNEGRANRLCWMKLCMILRNGAICSVGFLTGRSIYECHRYQSYH